MATTCYSNTTSSPHTYNIGAHVHEAQQVQERNGAGSIEQSAVQKDARAAEPGIACVSIDVIRGFKVCLLMLFGGDCCCIQNQSDTYFTSQNNFIFTNTDPKETYICNLHISTNLHCSTLTLTSHHTTTPSTPSLLTLSSYTS